jgi:hypothetical protein
MALGLVGERSALLARAQQAVGEQEVSEITGVTALHPDEALQQGP